MERLINPIDSGQFPFLVCFEMTSLIRSNDAWNTMMVNKAHSQFIDDSFGSTIAGKECESLPRVNVCSGENQA
jgi:hypothetical protein